MSPFARTLVISLAVAAASVAINPLVRIWWMPWMLVFWLRQPFGLELPYFFLVVVWIVIVVRAIMRFRWKGAWLLVAAPVVLVPAYVIAGIFINCLFFDYCL